jgi:hypothetical protein
MAWIITIGLLFGAGGFDDGDRGVATWYGSTSGKNNYCFDRYRNSCAPYRSGEQLFYAAMGGHNSRLGSTPYKVRVVNTANDKSIVVTVRDHCFGCWADGTGGRLIDLSPLAFKMISTNGKLNLGVLSVRVYVIEWNKNLDSYYSPGRARLLHGSMEIWQR